jgi:hypothetical protein
VKIKRSATAAPLVELLIAYFLRAPELGAAIVIRVAFAFRIAACFFAVVRAPAFALIMCLSFFAFRREDVLLFLRVCGVCPFQKIFQSRGRCIS